MSFGKIMEFIFLNEDKKYDEKIKNSLIQKIRSKNLGGDREGDMGL